MDKGSRPVTPTESRVGIRKDQVVVLGRYLFVFRPVIDSILDTIFWGDGYKSIAHIVLLLYLSYHHLCGVRFMFLFTVFHFFLKAGKRSECSEEEAVFLFKATVHDLTIVLRRYKPSVRHVWPVLAAFVAAALVVEIVLEQSVVEWIDVAIGPLTVVVILICYGLVDPRYTRNYNTPANPFHSRSSSQGSNTKADAPPSKHPEVQQASNPTLMSPLVLSPHTGFSTPGAASSSLYSLQDTPTAPWDELMPPHPGIPTFMHKVLMLYTKAPNWVDWKVTADTTARNHPISWTVVKAGLNVASVKGITFDEAVGFINDDPDFTKPVEKLNVWQYDKLLGEFRRLAIIDAHTRVVHMIYKQIIFAVAPRDAPMYMFAKELSSDEIEYYGLCRPHNNNSDVTDGVGRVFISSSAPADGVPDVKGHVRCVVHRQAIIIREVPAQNCVQIMTIVCGEPGGNVPARIVDMTRGEQLKIVLGMRKALLESHKSKKKTQ